MHAFWTRHQGRRPTLASTSLVLALLGNAAAAAAGMLNVEVRDALTGETVAGAFVMVGEAEGVPFPGNVALTDGFGVASFDDPALIGPQTVTAGAAGYSLTTLYRAAIDETRLRLFRPTVDPNFGGLLTEVTGEVDNVQTVSNDGNLDVSIVLPGITSETLAFFDPDPFLFGNELVSFPIVGDILLPENLFITPQTEFVFFVFEKSPYRIDVPGARSTSFVAVTARAAISELSEDPDLSALEIREFGVERDVPLGIGSQPVDVNSDIDLDPDGISVTFDGVAPGADLRIVSAALVGSGPAEELLGFATLTPNILDGATWNVAATNPVGDIADGTVVVSGVYQDSSSADAFAAGILDRGPVAVPSSVTFDSWMRLPELAQDGAALLWEDPTEPGVSPSPTWVRSTLGLEASTPGDGSVTPTIDWRIYAPAALGRIELPALPTSAPGGIPVPEATPEADQLVWRFTAANGSADPSAILLNFMTAATHWTQAWIPLGLAPSSAPSSGNSALLSPVEIVVAPSPSAAPARIAWRSGNERPFELTIVGANGRSVRTLGTVRGAGEAVWDGRDDRDRPAPAGVYWVVARAQGEMVGRQQIVRIR